MLGEQLVTDENYCILEPHGDLIKRGKVRMLVEFGHKIYLAESAAGLITQYVGQSIGRRPRGIFSRAPQAVLGRSSEF
ncbi:hypothetical protein ABIA43_004094 [Bradyrhizobium sp. USDA 328]